MKKYLMFACLLILTGCSSDYGMVVTAYEDGNVIAKELLLGGYTSEMEEYIDSALLELALKGNETAKGIVLQQVDQFLDPTSYFCIGTKKGEVK